MINCNWPRYLALGLGLGLLIALVGGCWGKAKTEAADPVETLHVPVTNNAQEPEPFPQEGQRVIEVLMQVEQEVITTSDVLTALAEPLTELGQQLQGPEFRVQAWKMIVQYLRARRANILLNNEAEAGLDQSLKTLVQRQVEAYEQRLLQKSDNSPTRLENKLREEGTTLEERLKDVRRELVVERYMMEQFRSRINITKQDIVHYYKQHHERYVSPKKVELLKIQIITAKHSDNSQGLTEAQVRAKQIAQNAWSELAEGAAFDQVARKYSDVRKEQGGNWGLVNPASLMEDAERKAIESLKEGECSDVLQNSMGYGIVGIAKIIPAKQTPLEDVQANIKQTLWRTHFNRLYDKRQLELEQKAATTFSPSARELVLNLAQQRFTRGN